MLLRNLNHSNRVKYGSVQNVRILDSAAYEGLLRKFFPVVASERGLYPLII